MIKDRILRIFDVLFSSVGIILGLLIFLLIAIIVKLSSRGPVLFIQKRVGKDGKLFNLYKFRSMVLNYEHHLLITIKDDQRITSAGKILRKYKLDELPQLINVLKGDMSLVGPRPEVKKYVDLYSVEQRKVLSIRPGITDYASIHFSNENEMLLTKSDPEKFYIEQILPEKIKLSMIFINNRSIGNYFRLLFLTITFLK